MTYAFKPIIVHQLYHEFQSSVIWLDSGLAFGKNSLNQSKYIFPHSICLILPLIALAGNHERFFDSALALARAQGGVLSDQTARDLLDFTHQGMFDYFEVMSGIGGVVFPAGDNSIALAEAVGLEQGEVPRHGSASEELQRGLQHMDMDS